MDSSGDEVDVKDVKGVTLSNRADQPFEQVQLQNVGVIGTIIQVLPSDKLVKPVNENYESCVKEELYSDDKELVEQLNQDYAETLSSVDVEKFCKHVELGHQRVTPYIEDDVGNKEELARISAENMEGNIISNEEVAKPNPETIVDISNKDKLARPSDEMQLVDEQAKLEHVKDVSNEDELSSEYTNVTDKKELLKQDIADNAMEGEKKDEIEGEMDGQEEEKLTELYTEAPQECEGNPHNNAIELCVGHCANEDSCGEDETNPDIYHQLIKELNKNEDHDPTTEDICPPNRNPHDEEAICKYGTVSGEQFQGSHAKTVGIEYKLVPEMYVENKAGVTSDRDLQGLHEFEEDTTVEANTGLIFENENLNKSGDDVILQMEACSKTDYESEHGTEGSQVDESTLKDKLHTGETTDAETLGANTREYEHEFGCTSGEPFSELNRIDESICWLDAVTEDEVITEYDWQCSPLAVDGLTVCPDGIDEDIPQPVVKQIDSVSRVCVEESHDGVENIINREEQTGIENSGILTTNTSVKEFKSVQNTCDNIPVPYESLLHTRLEAMIIQCIDDAIKCATMKCNNNSQPLQNLQTSEQLEHLEMKGDKINEFVDYSSQEIRNQTQDRHAEDKSGIVGKSVCFADEFVSGDSNLEEETELDSSLIKYAKVADVEESFLEVSELVDLKSDMQVLCLEESVCDFNSVTLANARAENTNNANIEDKTHTAETNRHSCESNQVVDDKETIDETSSNYVEFTDDESIDQPYEDELGDIIANEGCRLDLHIFEPTCDLLTHDTDFTSPTDSEGHIIINAALSEDEDYHRIMSRMRDQDTESDMNDSLDLVPGSDLEDSGHNQCLGDGGVDVLDAGERGVHLFISCRGSMCMLLECS